eukprot:TRINITY_DN15660_c0_g2_i1.p1 TRINITY_DN15660_c0_g2~~TRINITY_DN15660_c0_g2_i1.p1  ORF type:complete len:500 (+),score=117.16 TRINITY_DN15660_c0_g2_i1:132-1631(+)
MAEQTAQETVVDEEENDEVAEAGNDEDDVFGLEGVELEDHLKEAVEGSLRLKRLLSRDSEEGGSPGGKKRRTDISPEKEAMISTLLTKWMMGQDAMVRHVLEQGTEEELTQVAQSKFSPVVDASGKSSGEKLAQHMSDLRQRKSPTGYGTDHIAAAKFRWKFDGPTEQKLRKLPQKTLQYVLDNFDGAGKLDDVIEQAAATVTEESHPLLPKTEGVTSIGMFGRLELIDPVADCAVFGDANLTFSLRLAKHRRALGHVGRVIATTFEELETLRERYKEIDQSIAMLEEHCAEVFHGVDCTRIALDDKFKGMEGSLGAVYYNFPHSGAVQGFFDGHPLVNWRHENLMRLFFRALRTFVKEGGSVKVSSNAGATGVKYYYIINSALENEFEHTDTVPFLQWHLHRYGRSYGDRRDINKRPDAVKNQAYAAQSGERDMVYCFRYRPTGKKLGKPLVRLPPTLKTILACNDGPMRSLQPAAKRTMAESMYKRFVTEVSGTHVG